MATKTITITITGEEDSINMGLNAFVRQNGWNETRAETQLEYANDLIKTYFRSEIDKYFTTNQLEAIRQQAIEAYDAQMSDIQIGVIE